MTLGGTLAPCCVSISWAVPDVFEVFLLRHDPLMNLGDLLLSVSSVGAGTRPKHATRSEPRIKHTVIDCKDKK